MEDSGYHKSKEWFGAEHVLFWSNLSRLNGLIIILNISLFFLTGLVAQGYYYTFYSMVCLGTVGFGMIIPTMQPSYLNFISSVST
ncbi:MAG: hypothetical protein WBB19_16505 [Desulforhopalus sp.]